LLAFAAQAATCNAPRLRTRTPHTWRQQLMHAGSVQLLPIVNQARPLQQKGAIQQ
jgi:hypothetical protein